MAKKSKKFSKNSKFSKKPKTFQRLSFGKVYVQSTFNNTIVTLTDDDGKVLNWVSAGSLGFKGTKKSTPYTATLVGQAMADKIVSYGIKDIRVYISGVGPGRDSTTRAIIAKGINVLSISDITPIPHNGCRAKRPRRV